MTPATAPTSDSGTILVEHARADRELEAIARALSLRVDVLAAIETLRDRLAVHFAEEEQLLLPAYALEYPADAAAIAAQHAALQATLAAMRTLAEVGAFDAGALRKLRLRLHLHHAHEESGLYRWLARNRAGALRTP